jgi:hypothetical protein
MPEFKAHVQEEQYLEIWREMFRIHRKNGWVGRVFGSKWGNS